MFSFVPKWQRQHHWETKESFHSLSSSNLQSVVSRVQVLSTRSLLEPHHVQCMNERSLTLFSGLNTQHYISFHLAMIEYKYNINCMEYRLFGAVKPYFHNTVFLVNVLLCYVYIFKGDQYNHRSGRVAFFFPAPLYRTHTHTWEAIWLRANLQRQICNWMTACLHTLAFWQHTTQMSALTINWPIFNYIYS